MAKNTTAAMHYFLRAHENGLMVHICVETYVCVCVCVCVHIYLHLIMYLCIYTYIYA